MGTNFSHLCTHGYYFVLYPHSYWVFTRRVHGSWVPIAIPMGPGRAGGNPGELSPAQLRSSIRASLPGRAQGQFSGELGTAHVSEPAYQTCELLEISVGQGIVGLSRPTKHTLINYLHTSENICLLVYQIALQALRCCNL
jgi:hypothetical protein